MTLYELEIKGGGGVSLTARTDTGAIRQAVRWATDNSATVYLSWRRTEDGCRGYLARNGVAGAIGTAIHGKDRG